MDYELEYGTGTIEMHADSIKPGQKVVIIDDLIATGGTVEAIAKLVEKLGGPGGEDLLHHGVSGPQGPGKAGWL